MPVSTPAQFKTATKLDAKGLRRGKLRDVRGKNIRAIDERLEAYEAVRHRTQPRPAEPDVIRAPRGMRPVAQDEEGQGQRNRRGSPAVRRMILQLANDAFAAMRAINRAGPTKSST